MIAQKITEKKVNLDGGTRELEEKFCCVGDVLSTNERAQYLEVPGITAIWNVFNEVSGGLRGRGLSQAIKSKVYKICVRDEMLCR